MEYIQLNTTERMQEGCQENKELRRQLNQQTLLTQQLKRENTLIQDENKQVRFKMEYLQN